MTEVRIRGGQVLTDGAFLVDDLRVRDERIVPAGSFDDTVPTVDASGLLVAPGYVDLQCNGGAGIDLAREPERLWELGAQLPASGVTAWLPTIVTTPPGVVERAIAALAEGPPAGWVGAVPVGLHLEGPFLSTEKRGAHPAELLRPPTLDAIDGWSRAGGVTLVTMAPEVPGALEVIAALVERGVVVSLGHTAATAAQAAAGIDAGATWVTHLFNGMSGLHHREPGMVGVALTDARVRVGLIPDGVHVHPTAMALAQRALGERLTIVTDVVVHDPARGRDAVRLADGTLAGSTLAMDQGVRNVVEMTGCTAEAAIHAASTAPAELIGDHERGTLRPGSRADLVVLDAELRLVATVVGGEVLHGSLPVDGRST